MPRFASVVGAVVVAAAIIGGCSEPETGDGDLATGRQRVVQLVQEAAAELPAELTSSIDPPTKTGDVTCRRKILGFAAGSTGTRRAEVPLLVELPPGTDPELLLPAVEARWRELGYDVDRSGLSSDRYPKVRARLDGYEVVATADVRTPRLTFYAVSPCLEP